VDGPFGESRHNHKRTRTNDDYRSNSVRPRRSLGRGSVSAALNPGDGSRTPMSRLPSPLPVAAAATSSLSTSVSMPWAEVPSAAGFRG
jgi:hypothetical protein